MKFEDLQNHECGWLRAAGHSGIVLCSRVRIARNLEEIPFPNRASSAELENVIERVLAAAGGVKLLGDAVTVRMDGICASDREFLAERHLVSREFASSSRPGVVVIGEEEIISIMINEEDHLRLQVIKPGLSLFEAWQTADMLDTELGRELKFAFSDRWGFLASCPTNVGTGLRTSVMFHLPALVGSKRIVNVFSAMARKGVTPRGARGEGSEPSGDLFQVSNQITLGIPEPDIVKIMEENSGRVIEEEEKARDYLLNYNRTKLEDRVFRAYGVLQNSRLISSAEALECLSRARLGVQTGLLDVDEALINDLIISVQPAHLQKVLRMKLSGRERDEKRADYIRTKLKKSGGD